MQRAELEGTRPPETRVWRLNLRSRSRSSFSSTGYAANGLYGTVRIFSIKCIRYPITGLSSSGWPIITRFYTIELHRISDNWTIWFRLASYHRIHSVKLHRTSGSANLDVRVVQPSTVDTPPSRVKYSVLVKIHILSFTSMLWSPCQMQAIVKSC